MDSTLVIYSALVALAIIGLAIWFSVWRARNSKKKPAGERKRCSNGFQCGATGRCYALTNKHKEGRCYAFTEAPVMGFRL